MAIEDIKKYQFKPGQSGNPNGRPKNRAKEACEKLLGKRRAKTYYGMHETEIAYWDSVLLTAPKADIKKIASADDVPVYARAYAAAILADMGSGRTNTVDRLRANQFGQAAKKVEVVGADGQPLIPVGAILGGMSNEELMRAREAARDEEREDRDGE